MNHLVKVLVDDDGNKIDMPKWCTVFDFGDTTRVFCDGQALDGSSAVKYETKFVSKGGITCERCILAIKQVKKVRL